MQSQIDQSCLSFIDSVLSNQYNNHLWGKKKDIWLCKCSPGLSIGSHTLGADWQQLHQRLQELSSSLAVLFSSGMRLFTLNLVKLFACGSKIRTAILWAVKENPESPQYSRHNPELLDLQRARKMWQPFIPILREKTVSRWQPWDNPG